MSLRTQTSKNSQNGNGRHDSVHPENSGYPRLGYDGGGSLCVLDITYPNGDRKTLNKPGNSHETAKTSGSPDLNTSAFPASSGSENTYPGAFTRYGYDKHGSMVVLESGTYRRKEE
jgi:hypothetical protein